MTIDEALTVVDRILSQVSLNRQDHQTLAEAFNLIVQTCKPEQGANVPKLAAEK